VASVNKAQMLYLQAIRQRRLVKVKVPEAEATGDGSK